MLRLPTPGSALGEILQGVYQCKTSQPLERLLGHVSPKESELCPVQTLVTVGHIPTVETDNCDMGKSFAPVGDVHTS